MTSLLHGAAVLRPPETQPVLTCATHNMPQYAPPPLLPPPYCSGAGDRAENLPSHKWAYSLSQLLISTLFNSHRCVRPPSPLNSVFFSQRWQKKKLHQPHLKSNWWHFRVQRSRWWGCFFQKASSLGPNVRPHDSRWGWRRLTRLAGVHAATIEHKMLQGTWEQTSGPRRAGKITLAPASPKIMKGVDFEGSLCTFLQDSFPANS